MSSLKELFGYLGPMTSFGTLVWFSSRVLMRKFKKLPSTASWCMIAVVDGVLLAATVAAGKPFWFPLSYVAGASVTTLSLLIRGTWHWSGKETFCAGGAATAAFLWVLQGPAAGVYAGVTALTLAGMPMLVEMWKCPIRETFSLWILLSLACVFTLLGSDGSLVTTALPWSSVAFNMPVALFSLRGKKEGDKENGAPS